MTEAEYLQNMLYMINQNSVYGLASTMPECDYDLLNHPKPPIYIGPVKIPSLKERLEESKMNEIIGKQEIENENKNIRYEISDKLLKELKTPTSYNVNHPSHYETGKFECIEVMQEVFGINAVLNFCKCNAFKYIYRMDRKNGTEDVKKAIWYLNKYVELIEKED